MRRVIQEHPILAARLLPRLVMATLVAGALLFAPPHAADAALTTGKCLGQKRTAWITLRKCQGVEQVKQLNGKPTDLAKCQTKFQDVLAKISAKATKATIPCRYRANGDGTVTDYDTGLQWETKDGFVGGICFITVLSHCVNDLYTWVEAQSFVDSLNGSSADGLNIANAFAGYADWRLPTIVELETILLAPYPSCGTSPCIDPIFGPTAASSYWSATTSVSNPSFPNNAWDVSFSNGSVDGEFSKANSFYVRAVRSGL